MDTTKVLEVVSGIPDYGTRTAALAISIVVMGILAFIIYARIANETED